MLEISRANLPLLVSAVRDAIIYNEQLLRSETLRNVEDYEEYLLSLENFAEWLKEEYEKLEKTHPDLLRYSELVK